MGRNRLSDDEKRARGTFQSNTSADAYGRREVSKVLQFPVLREIPKPTFHLGDRGMETFNFWARKLLDAGMLTRLTLDKIEGLALADDKLAARLKAGREISDATLNARLQYLKYLEGLNVDTAVVAGQTKKSAFATNGFPNRLRSPAEHRARVVGGGGRGAA